MTVATDIWSYSILLLFFGVFVGYCVGRRHGLREGMERGLQMAPLEMLQSSWARGVCALCGNLAVDSKTHELVTDTSVTTDGAGSAEE